MKPVFLKSRKISLKNRIKTEANVEKPRLFYYKSRHSHSS